MENFFSLTIITIIITIITIIFLSIWNWKLVNPNPQEMCNMGPIRVSNWYVNLKFMWSYFSRNSISYDLRKGSKLFLPPAKSFCFGLNYIHFRKSIYGITFIPQSKIVRLQAKLKNWETFNVHALCVLKTCVFLVF